MKPRTRKKLQRIHSDITNELSGCFEPGHEPSLTKTAAVAAVSTGLESHARHAKEEGTNNYGKATERD